MKPLLSLPACVVLLTVLLPATDVLAQAYITGPLRSMNAYRAPDDGSLNSSGVARVYQPPQSLTVQQGLEPTIDQADSFVPTYLPMTYEMPDSVIQKPSSGEIGYRPVDGSTSTRSGLLGQSYFDAQFMMLSGPDDDVVNFMRAVGGRSSVNFPTPWLSDANSLFHQDLFLEFQYLSIGGFAPSTEVDLELTTGTIGTTLFMDTTDWFRPFLQLGWSYNRSSASITGAILNTQQREDDHDLLIRGGAEFDLSHNAAFRVAAGSDQYSTAELIIWPSPGLFFRLGGVMEFDVDIYGGLAGVGFTY
jgi:hypothetical protein